MARRSFSVVFFPLFAHYLPTPHQLVIYVRSQAGVAWAIKRLRGKYKLFKQNTVLLRTHFAQRVWSLPAFSLLELHQFYEIVEYKPRTRCTDLKCSQIQRYKFLKWYRFLTPVRYPGYQFSSPIFFPVQHLRL